MVVLISQMLLIALSISWFIHMLLIEINGAVYFVEKEPAILWTEIIATAIIIIFGGIVLVMQSKRLVKDEQMTGEPSSPIIENVIN